MAPPRKNSKSEDANALAARTLGPLLNKNLGQHILCNPLVANSIVEKAGLRDTDVVLEIGPGTGNLTVRMLERCRRVIAVEIDPRMAAELAKRVQGKPYQSKLQIIVGDFLQTELPYFDVCVSNTPYQISAPLTLKLLAHKPLFRCAVLMFQREFALRLMAPVGDHLYSRLSVNAQLYARVANLIKVGRNNFRPPPQVESNVIRMEPVYPQPTVDFAEWDGLLRICFSRKNRTLWANFSVQCVLDLCEANYKTFKALQQSSVSNPGVASAFKNKDGFAESTGIEGGCADDSAMDCEEENLDIKNYVREILTKAGYAEARANKLSSVDFMKLLLAFNDAGIHFTS